QAARDVNGHEGSERPPEAPAILSDQIVEVALAAEARCARARFLAQLLQISDVRDRGDDLVAREPLAVAQDVVFGARAFQRQQPPMMLYRTSARPERARVVSRSPSTTK